MKTEARTGMETETITGTETETRIEMKTETMVTEETETGEIRKTETVAGKDVRKVIITVARTAGMAMAAVKITGIIRDLLAIMSALTEAMENRVITSANLREDKVSFLKALLKNRKSIVTKKSADRGRKGINVPKRI